MNTSAPLQKLVLPSVMYFGYIGLLWAILAYLPIYLVNTGFSQLGISILMSIFPLTSLVLTVPLGIFSDKLPPRRLVTASLILFAVFVVGLRQTDGFRNILLFFIIGGIGDSLFRTSCMSLFYKGLDDINRGIKLGFFTSSSLIGFGLGPLLGGFLMANHDMDFLLLVIMIILAPFLILSLFLSDIEPAKIEIKVGDYRKDIASKEVIVLVALTFTASLHLGVEQTSLSLFMKQDIGLGEGLIGMVFFITATVMAVLAIATGFASDRIMGKGNGIGRLYYLGIFVSAVFNISLFFSNSFATVVALRLFHILGDSLLLVSRNIIVSQLFLQHRIGGNLGIINTTITLGTFVGIVTSGIIPGYGMPFVVAGAVAILAIPPAILARPKF